MKSGLEYVMRIKSPVSALVERVVVGTPCTLLQDGGCLVDSVGPAFSEAERVLSNQEACKAAQVP